MDQIDIADPIGGPIEYYETCAGQIRTQLERRVAELDL
jgi:protein-tyrosine-phosphatase